MVNDLKKLWPNEPVVLNIGLSGPKYARPLGISAGTILGRASIALREIMHPIRGEVVTQGKEPTLVVSGRFMDTPDLRDALATMVMRCDQDCISIYYPSLEEGFLFGAYADRWEPFDKSKVILPCSFVM